MISSFIINWDDLTYNYHLIDGVKIIKHYTKGCFLCCNIDNSIHFVTIEYDRSLIENIYIQDGIIQIIVRDNYQFAGRKFNKLYKEFKITSDCFEANINY